MLPIKLALAIGHRELRAEAAEVLEASPVRVVADCACFSSRRAFLAQVARAQPQIVLLEISELPTSLDDAVESLRLAAPAMVVALDRAADSEAILRAVRAGVDDYLYPPMHFTLRKLLERKSQELLQPCGVAAGGSVLAFLSARSGCGATTLACRVAGELAARGAGCGRRALLAGPGAMEHIPATDAGRWRAQVSAAPGGLDVLPATRETFSAGRLREFVSYIRARYRWSVLDLGHGWTPAACDAARFADQLFPVFTPELPALKNASRLLERLLGEGVGEEKTRLVLNQAPREMYLNIEEIEALMNLPVFAVVPHFNLTTPDDLLIPACALGRQLYRLAARAGQ